MERSRPAIPKLMEVIFDGLYLLTAITLGGYLLLAAEAPIASLFGVMALVLGLGDAFHLVPRIMSVLSEEPKRLEKALGLGKMITSMSMTAFYVLLWQVGLLYFDLSLPVLTPIVYALAIIRIILCFSRKNRWTEATVYVNWSLYRNIPFILLGGAVLLLFLMGTRTGADPLKFMWLAIFLSFAFYLPVVFLAHKNPKLGMLMLPKTCAYVWILAMGVGLL